MKMLTVRDVADRLGYTRLEPILKLINSGALKAVDTSASPGRRTLRIDPQALADFLAARTITPAPAAPSRRRKTKAEAVPEYV
jgi:hypothetical protein